MISEETRRSMLAAGLGAALAAPASGQQAAKEVHYLGPKPEGTPLFPAAVTFGNLVFVSGSGFNDVAGIRAQTDKLLTYIEKVLESVGSSMEKALKVNVYLADIRDYAAMNEVYRGRFGPNPPARTTVAVANIPLPGCLVEIEVIASR
jgi:enamine deaminase RidA (YjgF/YER057c/UK114 family)